jgi:farnesyl-diphosphate farnesyltransferase
MGLFLQKTNIIRDYLEDYVDGRAFWPQEVWKGYTEYGELGELAKPENRGRAVECLNHLITDALQCIPECLQYMTLLQTEEVFRFCAIPQVMAIATLSQLYNNPLVFTGVVKIRKGQAAQLILDTKTLPGLHKWFNILCKDILNRVPITDPSAGSTIKICQEIIEMTNNNSCSAICAAYTSVAASAAPVGLAWSVMKILQNPNVQWNGNVPMYNASEDTACTLGCHLIVLVICLLVLFAHRHFNNAHSLKQGLD